MKKNAFTLAETLIVIGIIGVVAALTLPNLNHATGDKEKVTKVLKIYSSLTEAFDRAEAVYGPVDEWFNNINEEDLNQKTRGTIIGRRISEFMKISKTCGFETGCFNSANITHFGADTYTSFDGTLYNFMTPDGMSIGIFGSAMPTATIYVDIDGPNRGKNAIDDDIFNFEIYDGQFMPMTPVGLDSIDDFYSYFEFVSGGIIGAGALWIIRYGNMDYLKLDSEYKCPNGTTPTDTHPSCN